MTAKKTGVLSIAFESIKKAPHGALTVLLAGDDLAMPPVLRQLDEETGGLIENGADAAEFRGRMKSAIEFLSPRGVKSDRLVVVGTGDAEKVTEQDWVLLGGYILNQISARKVKQAGLVAEVEGDCSVSIDLLPALLAFGARLRHYEFRKYRTRDQDENGEPKQTRLEKLTVYCARPQKAQDAFSKYEAIANGMALCRDLVNEPANVLGPVEFAKRAQGLSEFGLEIDVLDVNELKKLKMNALLGVGQGSDRPSRMVVMKWQGAKNKKEKPLAFVGKGVVFDTGGISIKPGQGMEAMKGDMGGAACVTGLMRTLAERKAKINAVGLIGCVENMPSGNAMRPGDIITSMSGQTIEVLNTDAEGRLVLADVLWYVQEEYKPKVIIDLATLTGAIMIALGKEFAGLFTNNDELADALIAAGQTTDEKVWRMPLHKAFDKAINTPNADMKNLGGRWGGSCTAAQFLQRFIKDDTPWAHIDLAGTAMDSTKNDINQSWASGWGVRLLNTFVESNYEKG